MPIDISVTAIKKEINMLKKIIITTLILCGVSSAYSQDCLDRVAKQAVLIDSLQRVIRQSDYLMTLSQTNQIALSDTIKSLRSDLSNLETFRQQKESIEDLLKTKSDSLALLKTQLSDKDQQIASAKLQSDQKARAEYERGKTEVLAKLVSTYKKPFDDLIKSSSKESVMRDIQLLGNNADVMTVLNDLRIYFNALDILSKKFDLAQMKNTQTQLNQIKQESTLLKKLKENFGSYHIFNDGLKETLNNLIKLDRLESVAGMDQVTQNNKFNKIMSELSAYIFNYDFNFSDYPYLSDIVLEIIKRKQPNADADVTDLLKIL